MQIRKFILGSISQQLNALEISKSIFIKLITYKLEEQK